MNISLEKNILREALAKCDEQSFAVLAEKLSRGIYYDHVKDIIFYVSTKIIEKDPSTYINRFFDELFKGLISIDRVSFVTYCYLKNFIDIEKFVSSLDKSLDILIEKYSGPVDIRFLGVLLDILPKDAISTRKKVYKIALRNCRQFEDMSFLVNLMADFKNLDNPLKVEFIAIILRLKLVQRNKLYRYPEYEEFIVEAFKYAASYDYDEHKKFLKLLSLSEKRYENIIQKINNIENLDSILSGPSPYMRFFKFLLGKYKILPKPIDYFEADDFIPYYNEEQLEIFCKRFDIPLQKAIEKQKELKLSIDSSFSHNTSYKEVFDQIINLNKTKRTFLEVIDYYSEIPYCMNILLMEQFCQALKDTLEDNQPLPQEVEEILIKFSEYSKDANFLLQSLVILIENNQLNTEGIKKICKFFSELQSFKGKGELVEYLILKLPPSEKDIRIKLYNYAFGFPSFISYDFDEKLINLVINDYPYLSKKIKAKFAYMISDIDFNRKEFEKKNIQWNKELIIDLVDVFSDYYSIDEKPSSWELLFYLIAKNKSPEFFQEIKNIPNIDIKLKYAPHGRFLAFILGLANSFPFKKISRKDILPLIEVLDEQEIKKYYNKVKDHKDLMGLLMFNKKVHKYAYSDPAKYAHILHCHLYSSCYSSYPKPEANFTFPVNEDVLDYMNDDDLINLASSKQAKYTQETLNLLKNKITVLILTGKKSAQEALNNLKSIEELYNTKKLSYLSLKYIPLDSNKETTPTNNFTGSPKFLQTQQLLLFG